MCNYKLNSNQSGGNFNQSGGNFNQSGGDYKEFPEEALDKASKWRAEVKSVQVERGISYREAMKIASQLRHDADPQYKTLKQRYVENLDDQRKSDRDYHPYGSKSKNPVSLAAAQQILLDYYRQRADQFPAGPLAAMKNDIMDCQSNPKRTLTPCPAGIRTREEALAKFPKCADSWKYRPGQNAKGITGPGYYDMDGVDNLCGPQKAEARKQSPLFNLTEMPEKTSKQTGGNCKRQMGSVSVTSPITGRQVKVGGEAYKKLVRLGHFN
jgi:hypothetical protein